MNDLPELLERFCPASLIVPGDSPANDIFIGDLGTIFSFFDVLQGHGLVNPLDELTESLPMIGFNWPKYQKNEISGLAGRALEDNLKGSYRDIVFAIVDWLPDEKFVGPFGEVCRSD